MPHIHEKIDFTVNGYLVYQGKVLLRMHDKYKIWLGVGGHVELDEDPNQALIREVKEEVGLKLNFKTPVQESSDLKVLVPPDFMNIHQIADGSPHRHIDLIYLVEATSAEVKPGGKDLSDQWKWFSKTELDDPQYSIREIVRDYAKAALEKFPAKF